jgi:hypothetical protein
VRAFSFLWACCWRGAPENRPPSSTRTAILCRAAFRRKQFGRRWRDLLDECAFSNPDWAALAQLKQPIREHSSFIAAIDPFAELKQAAPRALLMMNCDFDADQPKLYAVTGYRELRAAYVDQPSQLQLRIYPAGHAVTPEMQRDAVAWFRHHLLSV